MKVLTESEIYLLACLDQFKGKIDWKQVAADANIVSPDAARMRMQNLLKSRKAMSPSASPEKTTADEESTAPVTPSKKAKKGILSASPRASKVTKRASPRKARKSVKFEEEEKGQDDEIDFVMSNEGFQELTSGSDYSPSD